jgi:hypothetical protein
MFLWTNKIPHNTTFWLDLYTLSLLPSVSYMFSWPSTNYLCHSQSLLSSQLLGLMFQTALRRFHMHSSQFQKKFKVNYLLQIMTIHFAMRDINKHTHARVSTFLQLWRIWFYSVYITAYTKAKYAQESYWILQQMTYSSAKRSHFKFASCTLCVSIHPAGVFR